MPNVTCINLCAGAGCVAAGAMSLSAALKEALATELIEPIVREAGAPAEATVPVKKSGLWEFVKRLFQE